MTLIKSNTVSGTTSGWGWLETNISSSNIMILSAVDNLGYTDIPSISANKWRFLVAAGGTESVSAIRHTAITITYYYIEI